MGQSWKERVQDLADQRRFDDALDLLKSKVERDPFCADAHRWLGDLYLVEVEDDVRALLEFRKLQRIEDSLSSVDQLRLAWAYVRRSFEDKAQDILSALDESMLPESLPLLTRDVDSQELVERIRADVRSSVDENRESLFEKYRRKGDQYRKLGRWFEAQNSYEKALNYDRDPGVRIFLAECLINRKQFPRALRILKESSPSGALRDRKDELLTRLYRRLGLPQKETAPDEDDEDQSSARAS